MGSFQKKVRKIAKRCHSLPQGIGGSFPQPLGMEEERHYINLYESSSPSEKTQAKNVLIEHNLRLVAHIVKKFHHPDTDDLISIGTIGLIKAISSFNPKKGVRLATYASRCIENEIRMHLRAARKYQGDISIQDSIGADREGNKITYEEKLGDDGEDLAEIVALRMQVKSLYDKLTNLTHREREIIEMRYGLRHGDEITQREIGQMLQISRSYVSRIEKRALEKLLEELTKTEEKPSCPHKL